MKLNRIFLSISFIIFIFFSIKMKTLDELNLEFSSLIYNKVISANVLIIPLTEESGQITIAPGFIYKLSYL